MATATVILSEAPRVDYNARLPDRRPHMTSCQKRIHTTMARGSSGYYPIPARYSSFFHSTPSANLAVVTPDDDAVEERCCRACQSPALQVDWAQGDRVCTNCGLVDEERLRDTRPEWRDYEHLGGDQHDNRPTGGVARCGLVPVDETRYWGGLAPTTLSKYLYGGAVASASGGRDHPLASPISSLALARIGPRLRSIHRKIEARLDKVHAQALTAARISQRIRKKKKHDHQEQHPSIRPRKRKTLDDEGHLIDDDDEEQVQDHDDDDDDEDNDNDDEEEMPSEMDDSVRPEYDQLILQEDEDAQRLVAALYADKWSLKRAIQLYGTPHSDHNDDDDQEEDTEQLRQRLDATLKAASQDLYRAYACLQAAARRLELPDRVTHEATHLLGQWAIRRDGLQVRGVAHHLPARGVGASRWQIQEAKQALREYNKAKQIGALCSALLFLTARHMGWPRPMQQLCDSIQPDLTPSCASHPLILTMMKKHGELLQGGHDNSAQNNNVESFIKRKHLSRAMAEIKECFPDLARVGPVAIQGSNGTELSTNTTNGLPSQNPQALLHSTEYMLRKLKLPLVAEASIQYLVLYWSKHHHDEMNSKLTTLCGAMTYFVCHLGETMQTLARQAAEKAAIATKKGQPTPEKDRAGGRRRKRLRSNDSVSHLLLDDEVVHLEDVASENKAYEMQRMWDAWAEQQMPWFRTLMDIEKSCGSSRMLCQGFYQKHLYPHRYELLNLLSMATSNSHTDQEAVAGSSSFPLRDAPLASVLLPHVTLAADLMTEK